MDSKKMTKFAMNLLQGMDGSARRGSSPSPRLAASTKQAASASPAMTPGQQAKMQAAKQVKAEAEGMKADAEMAKAEVQKLKTEEVISKAEAEKQQILAQRQQDAGQVMDPAGQPLPGNAPPAAAQGTMPPAGVQPMKLAVARTLAMQAARKQAAISAINRILLAQVPADYIEKGAALDDLTEFQPFLVTTAMVTGGSGGLVRRIHDRLLGRQAVVKIAKGDVQAYRRVLAAGMRDHQLTMKLAGSLRNGVEAAADRRGLTSAGLAVKLATDRVKELITPLKADFAVRIDEQLRTKAASLSHVVGLDGTKWPIEQYEDAAFASFKLAEAGDHAGVALVLAKHPLIQRAIMVSSFQKAGAYALLSNDVETLAVCVAGLAAEGSLGADTQEAVTGVKIGASWLQRVLSGVAGLFGGGSETKDEPEASATASNSATPAPVAGDTQWPRFQALIESWPPERQTAFKERVKNHSPRVKETIDGLRIHQSGGVVPPEFTLAVQG
jgi:hypothetical protein